MKLEHIAPYLPFKIDVIHHIYGKIKLEGLYLWGHLYNNEYGEIELEEIKPILRPLSDLTKEIEVNGENVNIFDRIEIYKGSGVDYLIEQIRFGFVEVIIYNILLEHHFDIFGLIDQGLAIDINTLTK